MSSLQTSRTLCVHSLSLSPMFLLVCISCTSSEICCAFRMRVPRLVGDSSGVEAAFSSFAASAAAADVAEIRKNCCDCSGQKSKAVAGVHFGEKESEEGGQWKSLVFIFCSCQLSPLCMLHLVWPACVCVSLSRSSICISISASLSVFCAVLCHC